MTVLQPLTANLTPHPVPVAPFADLSRRKGSTDAYNHAKLNIPTAMRRHAGACGKGVVKSTNIGTNIGTN